jgi:hypothetical protein
VSEIDPIEFGRVLGIRRVVDRVDSLDTRVTRLESAPPASLSLKAQAIDKGLNTVLVAILAAMAKAFGVL